MTIVTLQLTIDIVYDQCAFPKAEEADNSQADESKSQKFMEAAE